MSYQPLLITGTPGRGQWALAKRHAKAYLCEQETKPCGFCSGCTAFDSGSHPDVWMLVDDGETITIDTARLLHEHTHQKPTKAPCRVVLIEHFDRATHAAQQSLLKIIEEPFVPTGIVFTARHIEKILPTIRSRMALIPMEPMPKEAFKAWCSAESILYDDWLYDVTDGSPFVLKGLDTTKLMTFKDTLDRGGDIQPFVDSFDRQLFYSAVYHFLARRAQTSLAMQDFERVDAWQALFQEVGFSKAMNWSMQVRSFLLC